MITFTMQVEDAMALIWMRRRRLYTGKLGLLMWSGLILVVMMGAGLIWFGRPYGIADQGYWLLGFYAGVWGLMGLSYAITPWLVRRRLGKLDVALRTSAIEWDDRRFIQQGKNTRTEVPWEQFTGWEEDKKLIVLSFDRIRKSYIPKRAFDAQSLQDFRRLLQAKITRQE